MSGAVDCAKLVGLLAERDRLAVFSALVLGARTVPEVAAASGLGAREVGRALQKLRSAGLVDGFEVRAELLSDAVRSAAAPAPGGHVVDRFVRDGRLRSMPAPGSKRRLVLEHVVQVFEPGRRFGEREVDAVLRAVTDGGDVDHATLRRYLVDHQLLARDAGEYWRAGGWVDVLG